MNKTQNRFLKGWSIHCFGHSASITRFVVLTIALLTFEGGTYKASAKWDREAWPISIGLYTSSNHVLTHDVMQLATLAVSIPLTQLTGRGMSRDFALYNMHFMSLEDNGENIGFKTGHPFGFTSYDLFNSLEWGVKIGWRGSESPIGIYVTGGYALNQYKLRFLGEHEYSKHKLQSWRPGLILNLSSYRFFMDELEWGFAPFAAHKESVAVPFGLHGSGAVQCHCRERAAQALAYTPGRTDGKQGGRTGTCGNDADGGEP